MAYHCDEFARALRALLHWSRQHRYDLPGLLDLEIGQPKIAAADRLGRRNFFFQKSPTGDGIFRLFSADYEVSDTSRAAIPECVRRIQADCRSRHARKNAPGRESGCPR